MSLRSARAIIMPLSTLLALLFAIALPAQSQGRLVLTAFPPILADRHLTYLMAVQLQDDASEGHTAIAACRGRGR